MGYSKKEMANLWIKPLIQRFIKQPVKTDCQRMF